jgi:hypothetical protein
MSTQYKPVAGLQQEKSEFCIVAKYSSDECVVAALQPVSGVRALV